MNKSASLRSNEDKLREAAHRNNLGVIRDLLARRTDPNSRDEVLHSFSDSFALLVDRKYFFFKSDYVFLIHLNGNIYIFLKINRVDQLIGRHFY